MAARVTGPAIPCVVEIHAQTYTMGLSGQGRGAMKGAFVICAAAFAACVSGGAFAQTCVAPQVLSSNADILGDTCAATNELGTLCIFALSPANDIVYSITLAPDYTIDGVVITNNTPTWNAAAVLIGGACDGNSACPRNADAAGAGASETLDLTRLTPGSYFIVVTSGPADTTCGSYELTAFGFIPVELQSFDVI